MHMPAVTCSGVDRFPHFHTSVLYYVSVACIAGEGEEQNDEEASKCCDSDDEEAS